MTTKFKRGDKVRKSPEAFSSIFSNGCVMATVKNVEEDPVTGTKVWLEETNLWIQPYQLELVSQLPNKHIVRFRNEDGEYLRQKQADTHEKAVEIAEEYLRSHGGHSAELFELEGVFEAPKVEVSYTPVMS